MEEAEKERHAVPRQSARGHACFGMVGHDGSGRRRKNSRLVGLAGALVPPPRRTWWLGQRRALTR